MSFVSRIRWVVAVFLGLTISVARAAPVDAPGVGGNVLALFSDRSVSADAPFKILAWQIEGSTDLTCRIDGGVEKFGGEKFIEIKIPKKESSQWGYRNTGWWGMGVHPADPTKQVSIQGYTHLVLSVKNVDMNQDFDVGFELATKGRNTKVTFKIPYKSLGRDRWNRFVFAIPEHYAPLLKNVAIPFFAMSVDKPQGGAIMMKDIFFVRQLSDDLQARPRLLPAFGETRLVVGQDQASVDAYLENFPERFSGQARGLMTYTSVQHANGLREPYADYLGRDDPHNVNFADHFLRLESWQPTHINLGLFMRGDAKTVDRLGVDPGIVAGKYDAQLESLRLWIAHTRIPVLLRVGYEFDSTLNAFEPKDYLAAYRHIVAKLSAPRPQNLLFVWHSWAAPTYKGYPLSSWYPGDEAVDVVGVSIFRQFRDKPGAQGAIGNVNDVLTFARSHGKPAMIAESTPYGGITDKTWEEWFVPMFRLIDESDIRLWSYINTDWEKHLMWRGQGWGDTRIQGNDAVRRQWTKRLNDSRFN